MGDIHLVDPERASDALCLSAMVAGFLGIDSLSAAADAFLDDFNNFSEDLIPDTFVNVDLFTLGWFFVISDSNTETGRLS